MYTKLSYHYDPSLCPELAWVARVEKPDVSGLDLTYESILIRCLLPQSV